MNDIKDANGLTEAEFLKQYDADKYPKPSLTADVVIFRKAETGPAEVLLIRRKGHPYIGHLALPGGFAERGETIETTAARELEEETGVTGLSMKLVGVYSKPGRDPRGWTVSAAYATTVKEGEIRPVAGDDAREVCWAEAIVADGRLEVYINGEDVTDDLAFDHYDIIYDAYNLIVN